MVFNNSFLGLLHTNYYYLQNVDLQIMQANSSNKRSWK